MREITSFDLEGQSNPGGIILVGGRTLQMCMAERNNETALACKKQKSGIQKITNV